jgi:hypothetical protein
MIFAKIDPVLSLAQQTELFNPTPEFITGSHMTAVAQQYPLGANQATFRVLYGTPIIEEGSVVKFDVIYGDSIILSQAEIETWGTDDSVILDIIALKQGTSIVEIISGSINNIF